MTTNSPDRREHTRRVRVGGPRVQVHRVTLAAIAAVQPQSCARRFLCPQADELGHGLAEGWRRDMVTKEISRYLTPATASMGDYP